MTEQKIYRHRKSGRRWTTALLVIIVLGLLALIAWGLFRFMGSETGTNGAASQCPFSGEAADASVAQRRPIIAQIDNAPAARPQAGLSQADIVYEALAEGDITRFSALFACHEAEVIGPVRSARLLDLELAPEYQALLADSGASQGVTARLRAVPDIPNIDHPGFPDAYYRVSDRFAPHNLMTSSQDIYAAAASAGHKMTVDFRGTPTFKDGSPPGQADVENISVPYSSSNDVSYEYDRETNGWLRFIGGGPHRDAATGRQIVAQNVIIQFVEVSMTDIVEDVGGSVSLQYEMTGSGEVLVFNDGKVTAGQWRRSSRNDITSYVDDQGKNIPLNRGQTWIQVVPIGFEVDYG